MQILSLGIFKFSFCVPDFLTTEIHRDTRSIFNAFRIDSFL